MVNLGDKVKDRINGFEGIVTGRTEYLYGCIRVLVDPTDLDKDGKPREMQWLDEDRVELVVADVVAAPASATERAGGPPSTRTPDDRR